MFINIQHKVPVVAFHTQLLYKGCMDQFRMKMGVTKKLILQHRVDNDIVSLSNTIYKYFSCFILKLNCFN